MKTMLLAVLCLSTLAARAEWKTITNQPPGLEMIEKKSLPNSPRQAALNYLIFVPRDYQADTSKHWPVILFLHGAGERGTNIWSLTIHGPFGYIKDHPDFPFIMIAPECPEQQSWDNSVLLDLLGEIAREYRVDSTRIYLTGLSMGGFATWDLGTMYPEKFAAIAPASGGGEMLTVLLSHHDKLAALTSLPVWAFHGGKDPTVPVSESRRMIRLMKHNDCHDLKLTVFPNAKHDCWDPIYNTWDLYGWFLKHNRPDAK